MAHSFFWRRTAAAFRLAMPGDCPLCGGISRGGLLCGGCRDQVCAPRDPERPIRCPRCALPIGRGKPCFDCIGAPPAFSRAIVAYDYLTPGDTLMRAFKSSGDARRADALAALLAQAIDGIPAPDAGSPSDAGALRDAFLSTRALLVPIPASAAGLRRRGFNPAGEVARALRWRLRLPLARGVLLRTRESGQQSARTREARLREVDGLFEARAEVKGRHVIIVDDVMTTGSTLDAAARAVLAQGAVAVTALAVARAVR
ncbi:MAG: phosphoribosyltransferase family protein [Achromobacter sp.]